MRRPESSASSSPPQRLRLLMLLMVLIASRASASVRNARPDRNGGYDGAAAAADDDWLIGESRSRRQPVAENPLDAMSWLNLRRFVCGGDANTRCLTDERFNQLQPDFLRKISARINGLAADERPRETPYVLPLPVPAAAAVAFDADPPGRTANAAAALLPVSHEYSNDVNIWNSLNLSGRREGPFYVDEPDFVLTKEEMAVPSLLFDYINDPFIPQRGRRRTTTAPPARKRAAGPPFTREAIDALMTTHHHRRQQQQQQLLHRLQRRHPAPPLTALQLLSLLGDIGDNGDNGNDGNDVDGGDNGYTENNSDADGDRVADRAALGNVAAARFFPRNLSPATGPTTTTATAAKPAGTNRDTFYLARGSCIHQQRQSQQQSQQQRLRQQRSPPSPPPPSPSPSQPSQPSQQ